MRLFTPTISIAVEAKYYSFLDRASYDRLDYNRAALLASFNVPTSLARPWFVDFNGYFGTHTCLDGHKKPTSCSKASLVVAKSCWLIVHASVVVAVLSQAGTQITS